VEIIKKIVESNGVEISVYSDGLILVMAKSLRHDHGGAFTIEDFQAVIKAAIEETKTATEIRNGVIPGPGDPHE
jgi:hypothetical protein